VGGGGLGLIAAWLIVQRGDPTGQLPVFILSQTDIAAGIILMVLMGLVAGIMPALSAMRLQITDALRRT
jgi:putative ABC transport system permease protein